MPWEFTYIYLLASILLLPLIPAYFLYKRLPSKTTVSGPFKGLNVQLTGSFGGYFILVLFSSGLFTIMQQTQQPSTVFHYNINFPIESFPNDLSDTEVTVHVKKQGQSSWKEHKDFKKWPNDSGIMISVNNIKPQDTLYISAKYIDEEWETEKSITIPVDNLALKVGHERKAFSDMDASQ